MTDHSKYWLESILDQVQERVASREVLVSSGITPSGPYHVGHAREILTAEAIRRGLELRGLSARHIHNVDDMDALRKRYDWLPESYADEAGKPVYLIPAPDGKSTSYAEQYFGEYAAAAVKLGIPMTIWRSHVEYQKGEFTDLIIKTLEARAEIARILGTISGRDMPSDWQPIQILDAANQNLRTAEYLSYDADSKQVEYRSVDGSIRQADITQGEVKLDWRVDWPARWALLGVDVEGFGKEHATKGGSYDTGAAICREIFDAEPPIPVPFNPINLKGDNRKMSSSIGNLVTIEAALEFIPPEILRYFVYKSLPQKVLDFDPGIGMYNLIDEFAATEAAVQDGQEAEFADAYRVAALDPNHATVSTIPFSHLVMTYQAAGKSTKRTLDILKRTHPTQVDKEAQAIAQELNYIGYWLQTDYAPENVIFEVSQSLPEVAIEPATQAFLDRLVSEFPESANGEALQTYIFESARLTDCPPRDAFRVLYQLFLNKSAGPKLGPFLADLEPEFVLARLKRTG
ncbi:MAG: lysine--tRNA ligase [bacterium]